MPHLVRVENGACGHDTFIAHGVERHLPYVVCIEDGDVQCGIMHGVELHLPLIVYVENGGVGVLYYYSAWCGASPAIYCVYKKWRNAMCYRAWCIASFVICCV